MNVTHLDSQSDWESEYFVARISLKCRVACISVAWPVTPTRTHLEAAQGCPGLPGAADAWEAANEQPFSKSDFQIIRLRTLLGALRSHAGGGPHAGGRTQCGAHTAHTHIEP